VLHWTYLDSSEEFTYLVPIVGGLTRARLGESRLRRRAAEDQSVRQRRVPITAADQRPRPDERRSVQQLVHAGRLRRRGAARAL